jgi:hypothetical protein
MTVQTGSYTFLDVNASIQGPGGNFSLSSAGLSDEGLTLSQASDKNTMMVGAAGDGMHSLRASTAARVTVSLLKTGTGNAQMNALYRHQSVSSAYWGQNTITITNAVTGDSIVLTGCAFVKQTDLGYKAEGGLNVWAFDCIASEQILGNNYQSTGSV